MALTSSMFVGSGKVGEDTFGIKELQNLDVAILPHPKVRVPHFKLTI